MILQQAREWKIYQKGKFLYVNAYDSTGCIDQENGTSRIISKKFSRRAANTIQYIFQLYDIYRSRGFKIHACGIKSKGKGLLFVGPSGAGKTTLAGLAGPERTLFHDDEIIIKNKSGRFEMVSILGQNEINSGLKVKSCCLDRIFFLKKSPDTEIIRLSKIMSFVNISRNSLWNFPGYEKDTGYFANTCHCLINTVPCYELKFAPVPIIWNLIDTFI